MLILARKRKQKIFLGDHITFAVTKEMDQRYANLRFVMPPATTLKCEHTGTQNITQSQHDPIIHGVIVANVILLSKEKLIVNDNISIEIFFMTPGNYKFGIIAPKNITILRSELYHKTKANQSSNQISHINTRSDINSPDYILQGN